MIIEKLERVMWRLRKNTKNGDLPHNLELQIAIMHECGTSPETYRVNRKALIKLGWIKTRGNKRVFITGKDMTDT